MTEKQIINAMTVLVKLYADQKGLNITEVKVQKKGEKRECLKTQ
jgi:hypothetical protein